MRFLSWVGHMHLRGNEQVALCFFELVINNNEMNAIGLCHGREDATQLINGY